MRDREKERVEYFNVLASSSNWHYFEIIYQMLISKNIRSRD